jgi:hypothetical protein
MRRAWDSGQKVEKCIGFDATEDHRIRGGGGTYAVPKKMNIAPMKGVPHYRDRYTYRYPLREWGLDRRACGRIITEAGLPLPPKSACFFCPAMRLIEIERLKVLDPAQAELALVMEDLYRTGHHFRGDDFFTVTAERKDTKEKVTEEIRANDKADARQKFRQAYSDTVKPHRYKLAVSPSVRGLSRDKTWAEQLLTNI